MVPDEFAPKEEVEYDFQLQGEFVGDYGSGLYYGDASGGPNTKYSTLRRVGCAFIKVEDGVHVASVGFNLPGEIQTVFRG